MIRRTARAKGGMTVITLVPYQCVLLVSFGGPEGPEQVVPFLRSVTAGRGIPDERLAEVGRHYTDRGGRSPINDETRALRSALADELARRNLDVPVLYGNRHLEPSLAGVLAEAAERGFRRVVAVLTSAYPSYSGCRQYREDLAAALAGLPETKRPRVDKLAPYAGHPGFYQTVAALTARSARELIRQTGVPAERLALVFVTHSIPTTADERSGPPGGGGHAYTRWHAELADLIATRVRAHLGAADGHPPGLRHDVVYCSRSGPPGQPWLEPDVSDHLETLAAAGFGGVVVVPFGFVADHMEVVYDLDTEAAHTAARRGLAFTRVPTVRTHPDFVAGLVDLLVERAARARATSTRPRGESNPTVDGSARSGLPDDCVAGCCPNPRGPRPAVCGEDA